MSEEESTTEFTHSELLFLKDTGECLRFYMRPCRERARLRQMIEHGGGHLSGKCHFESIKLCVAGDVCYSDGYHDSSYINDCVENNSLLDLKDYQVENMSVKEKSTSHIIKKGSRLRNPYTEEEDNAILLYVAERPTLLNGNFIWKVMEGAQITSHPWQSMKCRFQKQLKDRLPEFIDKVKKQRLNKNNSSFDGCDDISCEEEDASMVTAVEELKTPSSSKMRTFCKTYLRRTTPRRNCTLSDDEKHSERECDVEEVEKQMEADDEDGTVDDSTVEEVEKQMEEDGTADDSTEINTEEYDTADEQRKSDTESETAEESGEDETEGGYLETATSDENINDNSSGEEEIGRGDSKRVTAKNGINKETEGSDTGRGTAEDEIVDNDDEEEIGVAEGGSITGGDTGVEEDNEENYQMDEDKERIFKHMVRYKNKYGLTCEQVAAVYNACNFETEKATKWFKKLEQS